MNDLDTLERPGLATRDAEWFEYSKAANPIRPSLTPPLPYHVFPASLHEAPGTGIVPLDLSAAMKCQGPATSPGLCASFLRIAAAEALPFAPMATSQVLYVIRGSGTAHVVSGGLERAIDWAEGDVLALPGGGTARHVARGDAALYAVDDSPLLSYLGVRVAEPRFEPTLFPAARNRAELDRVAADPAAADRSRISVLLANARFPTTRTITHTLWAMFGLVPEGAMQKPHRHQSVALDYIVDCRAGCYSLVGRELDAHGAIRDAQRVDWASGIAFVTPPGYWHSHHNESGAPAHLIPIQDAGLQTYLRSLDIRFA